MATPNPGSPTQTRTWVGKIRIWWLATPNPSSPPQTRTVVGENRIWELATPNSSLKTQVRNPKLEFGLAKSVYEGWPPQTQVYTIKFASPNSSLGLQNPYMNISHPKLKFPNASSSPQTRTWNCKIRIWWLPPQARIRHPKFELGLAKAVYEGWPPQIQVSKPNFASPNSNLVWRNP